MIPFYSENDFMLEFTETTNVMIIEPWYKIQKKFNERNETDFYNVEDIILSKNANKGISGQGMDGAINEEFGKIDENRVVERQQFMSIIEGSQYKSYPVLSLREIVFTEMA